MKTSLTYGFLMALGGAILTLALYFLGFHDSPEKLSSAQWIGTCTGTLIGIVCLTLAMREKRAAAPADSEWGYGSALGGGVLTGVFAALFGMVSAYAYFAFINPHFPEVVYQAQLAKMEEKGMTAEQLDRAGPMIKKWMSPAAMTLFQGLGGLFFSVLLSLIIAIFVRVRPTVVGEEPPALT